MSALPLSVEPQKRVHFLHAGHLYIAPEPTIVTTILGSCVSVCLWDERAGVGGINHFLLPHRIPSESSSARFGTLATHELIDALVLRGATTRTLRAKVFGGASIAVAASGPLAVGTKNAEVAMEILAERGIPVLAQSLGGSRGRKVVFHTDTGETLVREI